MSQDYHRLLESHLLFTFSSQRAATVDILAPRMDPAQEGLGRAYSGVIFTGKGGGRILKFGSHTLLCTTLSPFFPSFFSLERTVITRITAWSCLSQNKKKNALEVKESFHSTSWMELTVTCPWQHTSVPRPPRIILRFPAGRAADWENNPEIASPVYAGDSPLPGFPRRFAAH